MKIIAPLYRYPTLPGWDRVIAARPSSVVINPDSGPGVERKPGWTVLIQQLVSNGIRVLGYIATGYANESEGKQIWRVNEERERYTRFYPTIGSQTGGGYFYDESASEPERRFFYEQLLRSGVGGVEAMVLNQGTIPDIAYSRLPLINTAYETSFDRYMVKEPPQWTLEEPNTMRWYHIVYSVRNAAQMRLVVETARKRKAGFVWCCQDPATYNLVPDYLEEMAALVKTV